MTDMPDTVEELQRRLAAARTHYALLRGKFDKALKFLRQAADSHTPHGKLKEGVFAGVEWVKLLGNIRAHLEDWE